MRSITRATVRRIPRSVLVAVFAASALALGAGITVAAIPNLIGERDAAGAQLARHTWEFRGLGCAGSDGAGSCEASGWRLASTSPSEVTDAYVTLDANAIVSTRDVGLLRMIAVVDGERRVLSPGTYRVLGGPGYGHFSAGPSSVHGAWRIADVPAGVEVALKPTLKVVNTSPRSLSTVQASLGAGLVSIEYSRSGT